MASNSKIPLDELAAELFDDLRGLARRSLLRGARLDPTELVNQAWVRLARSYELDAMPREDFLALCATIMRRLAVDEGRRRLVERCGGDRITLSGVAAEGGDQDVDLMALDEALDTLKGVDARWARIVELRFFGGLTEEEVARVLGLSRRTIVREWKLARAWLKIKLG